MPRSARPPSHLGRAARALGAPALCGALAIAFFGCGGSGAADAGVDLATPDLSLPPLPMQPPLGPKPADPLAGKPVEGCALYQQTRCQGGVTQTCAVYDPQAGSFVAQPDPLLHRALLFDRYYDLYQQPDGQTAERGFDAAMPASTPESIWGSVDHFSSYSGDGDSGIWTGVALHAYALRYAATGTQADLARLVDKTRKMLTLYDVTGVPGYLARHHYLQYPDPATAPHTDQHIVRSGAADPSDHVFDPKSAPDLPAEYTTGVPDGIGAPKKGTPMWHGNPSIDQYSGPEVALPIAWEFIDDPAIKARIATHLTCYLKRLERIEISNLQQNAQALASFNAYFAGGTLKLDPTDIDLSKIDTVVIYALPQLNAKNAATYPAACPDHVATTATRVIDAASSDFLLDVIKLVGDLNGEAQNKATAYDHSYAPSVRGGDAIHLMHLAAVAYHLTGDDQYRRFLYEDLMGPIHAVEIALTTGALRQPKWCRSFYGDHITFAPLWSLITTLGDSPLRTKMQQVMREEMYDKLLGDAANLKFDLMYAGTVPPAIAGDTQPKALAEGLSLLAMMGGNGGDLDQPRRSYLLGAQAVEDQLGAIGNALECPTPADRHACEDGIALFGIKIPGSPITGPCTGAPGECTVETADGGAGALCAPPMARDALPVSLRDYEDFLWQRNPYSIGGGGGGDTQSPGLDLTEEYWLARHYGFVTAGQGQVLAWQPGAACTP